MFHFPDARAAACLLCLVVAMAHLVGCDSGETAGMEPSSVETVEVNGFDPDGEPVIERWSDGSVTVQFEAMPPFFAEDDGTEAEFENFERLIEQAVGVPVMREDRELFRITKPQPDTAQQLQQWLETYRDGRS